MFEFGTCPVSHKSFFTSHSLQIPIWKTCGLTKTEVFIFLLNIDLQAKRKEVCVDIELVSIKKYFKIYDVPSDGLARLSK